jgi:hypothetical protein
MRQILSSTGTGSELVLVVNYVLLVNFYLIMSSELVSVISFIYLYDPTI